MHTVGVDLAAEATNTAVAWLDWSPRGAAVRDLVLGADDDVIVEAVSQADKAGIDCPFGWPESFVTFISAHRDDRFTEPEDVAGRDWRRRLSFRRTDEAVRALTGLVPLSVATDRIAHPAMRCASLLARLAREGLPVDRSGSGVVVEVYPAASLKQWGLPYRRYKRSENLVSRGRLVDDLLAAADWLTLGRHEQACRASDDALDAVIAALTAYAAFQGLTVRPSPTDAAAARTEGWIMIPASRLSELAPRLTGWTVQ
jgi:predicted nuclease with RNAse H fold